jgi:hypothetical protein
MTLLDLQAKILTRLTADIPAIPAPVPANGQTVTWMTEIIGDLVNKVQKTAASTGIVGTVLTPGGDRLQLRDPKTGQIALINPIVIEITENVIVNRAVGTQIAALTLVEFCMKRLNLFELTKGARITRVTLDPKPFELVAMAPLLIYHVRANAHIDL